MLRFTFWRLSLSDQSTPFMGVCVCVCVCVCVGTRAGMLLSQCRGLELGFVCCGQAHAHAVVENFATSRSQCVFLAHDRERVSTSVCMGMRVRAAGSNFIFFVILANAALFSLAALLIQPRPIRAQASDTSKHI